MAEGFLTTHVLDTARGVPAAGLRITLDRIEGERRERLAEAVTNGDGRTDGPILPRESFAPGTYELTFHAGDYLRATGRAAHRARLPRRGPGALRHGGGALPRALAAVALRLFHLPGELRMGRGSTASRTG
jgi:hypothetical protein